MAMTPKEEAFHYQLDLLKQELQSIDQAIARFDDQARATRGWAIAAWTGSVAVTLNSASLKPYLALTAIVPVLFWLVDARWNSLLRRFLFRERKIRDFLNSEKLVQSFGQARLVDFHVYDPAGKEDDKTPEYKDFVSFWRSMIKYGEVSIFYVGMIVLSITLAALLAGFH
jgi:hypothetical protein